MLLTITTTYRPASDLSYLLHKHPDRVQEVEFSAGKAHLFYPEISEDVCTIALLLDIDPIGLVRRNSGPGGINEFALEQYVNDRPYVASSFMSAALIKAFSTAMNGRCKDRPELVGVPMPFEVQISVLPVRGGEEVLRQLFEPLGYSIVADRHPLDPAFPGWGVSRYFTVRLTHTLPLQHLLSHLYILLPVCDNDKHYWVGEHEVEKLLEKGKEWLAGHPAREMIAMRYLKHRRSLANLALDVLLKDEAEPEEDEPVETKVRAHDLRLVAVRDELLRSGASSVVDLGCGEGKLLQLLIPEKQFGRILGMDVSYRSLEIARDKLKLSRMTQAQQQRVGLIHGSLTYRDQRIKGFDAAALVEVIEHLDEPRLAALEKTVFRHARPMTVIITTPNAEYNVLFPDFVEGNMRHGDHRFEWTRKQFEAWGQRVADEHGYTVRFLPVGREEAGVGALSQMGIFVVNLISVTDEE
ncbi:MAG TPA: 3' terminal RNA ribose 2'-O-methyltransferase Hen1 [Puia sp.]|nr:3' terminal RNA ribose 2'-O-methyltransferase Hen1 [Puia sp.]